MPTRCCPLEMGCKVACIHIAHIRFPMNCKYYGYIISLKLAVYWCKIRIIQSPVISSILETDYENFFVVFNQVLVICI